jgi:hypothetical protein
MRKAAIFAAMMLFGIGYQNSPTAVNELTELRKQGHAAHVAGDKAGYLDAALKVRSLLHDSPNALLSVARAYTEAGDREHAMATLREFAAMGQVEEGMLAGTDTIFAALHDLPAYKSLFEDFQRNKTAVARSEKVFALGDAGLIPEDIDFDPRSKTFLITSVLEKKIIRVTSAGQVSPFASSPSGWPMLAVKVDAQRKRVWATEVALDGFTSVPKGDWGKSAVLCFDLETGKLLNRIEGPLHAALGDMALTPAGIPIVSDGEGGGVYKVEEGRLALINGKDFISPQTGVVLPGGKRIAVPDYLRGIGLLDIESGRVQWINEKGGAAAALNGVDGLNYFDGALMLTQNGTSPERVVRMKLDRSLTRVVEEDVIERDTATLGDPTHGVVVGDWFYYIANSGWDVLDDHSDVKAGAKLSAGLVMRFKLR